MTQRTMRTVLGAAILALLCVSMPARAEGYINPWVGVNFGTNTDNIFDTDASNGTMAFGVNAGGMGAGIVGAEAGFGYGPSFFAKSDDIGTNTVMDLMANLIVGVPFGGTRGAGLRPFVTGGIGLIRSQFDSGVFVSDDTSENDLGWNVGAGVMGYFSDHVGVRGDVRYTRSTGASGLLDRLDLSNEKLRYWRATIGLVLR